MTRRVAIAIVLGVVGLSAGGCSGSATVSGMVTVGGTPLPSGTVMVQDATGEVRLAGVTNGAFSLSGVARGPAKVAVVPGVTGPEAEGPSRKHGQFGRGRARREKPVAEVPGTHQRPETSPWTVQVDRRTVTIDLAIP
jgi:hypothetical protein